MGRLRVCARRAWPGTGAVVGLLGLCCAAPVRAQQTNDAALRQSVVAAGGQTTGTAAPIRAASEERTGRNARVRFSLGRLLRDAALGVTWDRARLPLSASVYGNTNDPVSVRLTLSRRDFSGATLRFRF